MKRYTFLLVLLAVFVTDTIARAQAPTAPPAGQRQGGGQRQGPPQQAGQRQGAPQQGVQPLEILTPGAELATRRVRIIEDGTVTTVPTAWWTNTALVNRLGLTDVQKTRIESAFESHRQNLLSNKQLLEKEEAQLAKLLDGESVDRGAVFTQINRVIQARGEMERTNATMTLEMREQLTRAQWTQLQVTQPGLRVYVPNEGAIGTYQLRFRTNQAAPGAPGLRGGNNGQQ